MPMQEPHRFSEYLNYVCRALAQSSGDDVKVGTE